MAQCEGTSKKTGERCTAPAVTGKPLCAGHLGLGVSSDPALAAKGTRASAVARVARAERRKAGISDVAAAELERHAAKIVRGFLEAAESGDWRAAEALWTRVYGKPVERVETTSVDVDELTAEERASIRRRLLTEYPALREVDAA